MKLVPVAIASCITCRAAFDFQEWSALDPLPSKPKDFEGSERRRCDCGTELVALVDFIPAHGLWENAERYAAEHPHSARSETRALDVSSPAGKLSPTPIELAILGLCVVLLAAFASALVSLYQAAP